jgi:Peptidase family S41/PDZ domain
MPNITRYFPLFLLLAHFGATFGDSQKKKMLSEIDFITNIFEISYAPSTWKSEHFGWDLNEEKAKAMNLVTDHAIQPKDFHKIIKDFCLSTKDYHVAPDFYSTEQSSLPFGIKSAEGKYFISYIEDAAFYEYDFPPLSIGDQIVSINKQPIGNLVDEFRLKEIGSNYIGTDQALAEFYFTSRFGRMGHEIPKGSVEVVYRKESTNEKRIINLDWNYQTEKIIIGAKSFNALLQKPLMPKHPWQKIFMTPHCSRKRASNEDMANLFGARTSIVPQLGPILWESAEASKFHAYLFPVNEEQVGGYLRIPSYYVDDSDNAATEFAEIIELFEELTDILVIDQLNNGGGTILYLYALLSMLTDRELELMQHRMMLTQEDLYTAISRSQMLEKIKNDRSSRKNFGDTLEGVLVNHRLIRCLLNSYLFVIDQWDAGKLLTDYTYLFGIEKIIPHPEVKYTKPMLVLVNSLNFSAADFFPAIIQDNKRGKIMGTRTAGAGGYIERISFRNLNGIEGIDITGSFSIRSNGMPIENYGVTPDILYEISQVDLQNNYSEYKLNILKEIKNLLLGM